ncbi:alpha/beta fold hydrolase [Paracoccus kondratievae]|uniref:alpha/beta fold hydrolase n=2 Tax=Paracoccus kondratievae TaxID=135740 RepID=UPI0030158070
MSNGFITASDGTRIFYKDWGPKDAQPIVFHHGWPLSADDWDNQMLYFLSQGYRVIAHDRRGHGRSDQTDTGNEMDTYAADVAGLAAALDLKNAIHIGHSTGGGEVARVRRQNIWLRSGLRLAESGPRLGVDVMRRACGAASADVRWSFV